MFKAQLILWQGILWMTVYDLSWPCPLRAMGAPTPVLHSRGSRLHTLALNLAPYYLMNLYCETFTIKFQDVKLKIYVVTALNDFFMAPVVLFHALTFFNESSDFIK